MQAAEGVVTVRRCGEAMASPNARLEGGGHVVLYLMILVVPVGRYPSISCRLTCLAERSALVYLPSHPFAICMRLSSLLRLENPVGKGKRHVDKPPLVSPYRLPSFGYPAVVCCDASVEGHTFPLCGRWFTVVCRQKPPGGWGEQGHPRMGPQIWCPSIHVSPDLGSVLTCLVYTTLDCTTLGSLPRDVGIWGRWIHWDP